MTNGHRLRHSKPLFANATEKKTTTQAFHAMHETWMSSGQRREFFLVTGDWFVDAVRTQEPRRSDGAATRACDGQLHGQGLL